MKLLHCGGNFNSMQFDRRPALELYWLLLTSTEILAVVELPIQLLPNIKILSVLLLPVVVGVGRIRAGLKVYSRQNMVPEVKI